MKAARPPRLAEWLLARSLAPDERDAILGDLLEELDELAREADPAAAARWYWRQTIASMGPNLRRRLMKTVVRSRRSARRRQRDHERPFAMDSILLDIRYAWRMLQQRPLFSLVALASLTIGISLSTVVFSLLNAAVLRPLPVIDPDRLALVLEQRASGINHNLSLPDFADYRASQQAFVDLAAHSSMDAMIRPSGEARVVSAELVSGGLFAVVGIRMLAGRPLMPADDRPESNGAAVGARLRFDEQGPDLEVVGVARDVKYRMLREEAAPSFYIPLAQSRASFGVLHVRTAGPPAALLPTLRQTLQQADANVPVTEVRTLREQAEINLKDERLAMLIALVLGGAALLLAAVGLYGSMAFAVGQRTREIGVRVALGATSGSVRQLVLGDALKVAAIGTSAGIGLALLLARAVESRLFGVTATDPVTLAASAALLMAVALAASYFPARHATEIDPVDALRTE